jgi:hypothetical protein
MKRLFRYAIGNDVFGPWTTALDVKPAVGLSSFWKRRMAMLEELSTRSRMSGRWRAFLLAAALAIIACPLVYMVETSGVGTNAPLVAAEGAASTAADSPVMEFFPQPTESEKKILEALGKPTEIDFVETSLSDVVDFLKDFHGIEIQIDKKSLEGQGLGNESKVTRKLIGVPLRSALRLSLRPLGLSFFIANDVLLITTLEEEDANLVTRTYPVGDLAGRDEYTSLRKAITNTVAPTTWDEVGGPGSLNMVEKSASMVVSQTQRVHDEILELLRSLRAAKVLAKESGQLVWPPSK